MDATYGQETDQDEKGNGFQESTKRGKSDRAQPHGSIDGFAVKALARPSMATTAPA